MICVIDNQDIERERRELSVRFNIPAGVRCSTDAKIALFKAYIQSFYSSGLCVKYAKRA